MTTEQAITIGALAVQAIATVVLVVVAGLAWRAAVRQAEASATAVEAARQATVEGRRQQILALSPFLELSRPMITPGAESIIVPVHNAGPGQALGVHLRLEAQDQPGTAYHRTMHEAWIEPVVLEGGSRHLTVPADDLRNLGAMFALDDYGQAVTPADALIPARIRARVAWLSMFGARIEHCFLWETRDVTGGTPWSWRFESLTIDPGATNGPPLVVQGPAV